MFVNISPSCTLLKDFIASIIFHQQCSQVGYPVQWNLGGLIILGGGLRGRFLQQESLELDLKT